jgi:hypothetical protein
MILALDQATRTGFCFGAPGDNPSWGIKAFGGRGRTNGEIVSTFRLWLFGVCCAIKPTLVVFEAPYVPRMASAVVLRRLLALAGTIEAVTYELKLPCREASAMEISRFFLGRYRPLGRAGKKAATIETCAQYGFDVDDDNIADAISLWLYAEATIAPDIAALRGIGPLMVGANTVKKVKTPEFAALGVSVGVAFSPEKQNANETFNNSTSAPQGKINRGLSPEQMGAYFTADRADLKTPRR